MGLSGSSVERVCECQSVNVKCKTIKIVSLYELLLNRIKETESKLKLKMDVNLSRLQGKDLSKTLAKARNTTASWEWGHIPKNPMTISSGVYVIHYRQLINYFTAANRPTPMT